MGLSGSLWNEFDGEAFVMPFRRNTGPLQTDGRTFCNSIYCTYT